MASKEYNPTSIDPEVKKNLVTGYYNRFTGKKYPSKTKRDQSERSWKMDYYRANRKDFASGESMKDKPASYWQKHSKYSTKYGSKDGGAYNIETARVDYKSDWVGPDHEGANDNPNFRKVWSALTLDQQGGISKKEYSHMKTFLVKIKQGGTKLANMTAKQANEIVDVVNDFKFQAAKQGITWDKNSYKSDTINSVAKELAKTDDYKWLDTKVPTIITKGKDGNKFFDYTDKFTRGFADLAEDTAKEYESKYIDEVFGTDKTQVGTEGSGKLQEGKTTVKWGVDLVRTDVKDLEVGSQKHYEHITRGKVNWAHYRDDKWFNKAAKHLEVKAGDITAKGDHTDQIHDIREVNDLLNSTKDKSKTDWGKWHKDDWQYEMTGVQYEMDDKGVLWKGDPKDGGERVVGFSELMDKDSDYYIKPGEKKEFHVGTTKDGEKIMREYESPVTDMSDIVYDPDDEDQSKDHTTPLGWEIEGKVKKQVEDIKRPNITGIKWDGNTPKLKSPVKEASAPTISPLSSKSWAQKATTTKK